VAEERALKPKDSFQGLFGPPPAPSLGAILGGTISPPAWRMLRALLPHLRHAPPTTGRATG